ncbi:hypothetical protein L226DRAFT_562728 [Lentinus tigrinus ALCF2SS1-7]|uniref:Uncharacterized protein n=1 Tax=Lentinus tigrinus ALCF2SS1-6 TaxID=1328759 RepID=A0A5C2RUZ3_9APHY|nr:hypothetical protein L227DRAFT_579617 [Lentinus tigrinus ALCF2SS1-6]RPD70724.1 hypothetical protein L226DRAFT_562728 [Lentinus tigrinus ALCF2SS1-7]
MPPKTSSDRSRRLQSRDPHSSDSGRTPTDIANEEDTPGLAPLPHVLEPATPKARGSAAVAPNSDEDTPRPQFRTKDRNSGNTAAEHVHSDDTDFHPSDMFSVEKSMNMDSEELSPWSWMETGQLWSPADEDDISDLHDSAGEHRSGSASPDFEDDVYREADQPGLGYESDESVYEITEGSSTDSWSLQNFKNLDDLLRLTSMPEMSPVYSPRRLQSTKGATKAECDISPEHRLKTVVVCPALLDPLLEGGIKLLSGVSIRPKDVSDALKATRFLPRALHAVLPKVIWTEGDVVAWCESSMLRPSMECAQACLNTSALDAPKLSLSSVPSQKINADRVIWDGTKPVEVEIDGKAEIADYPATLCSIEVKSPNVFTATRFKDLDVDQESAPSGTFAIRFSWPMVPKGVKKTDRIIVQAWAQMVNENCNYGVLTCHSRTVFLIRSGQTLYFSGTYLLINRPQFWMFCLIMLAKGKLQLDLPQFNTDHWPPWASLQHDVVSQSNVPYAGIIKQTTWTVHKASRGGYDLRARN